MDIFTPEKRSEIMSRIRSKDTAPEMTVRRLVHAMGYRYRLHRKDLPGKPDLTFPKLKAVIFVHGCFWHGHEGCRKSVVPKSNISFWEAKIKYNRSRDAQNVQKLVDSGWRILTIWECETRDLETLSTRIRTFLTEINGTGDIVHER